MDRGRSDLRGHCLEYRRWLLSGVCRGKDYGVVAFAVIADWDCLKRGTDLLSAVAGHRAR